MASGINTFPTDPTLYFSIINALLRAQHKNPQVFAAAYKKSLDDSYNIGDHEGVKTRDLLKKIHILGENEQIMGIVKCIILKIISYEDGQYILKV